MQLPPDQLNGEVCRMVNPHHLSVVIVQVHVEICLELDSKVRGLMARRRAVQAAFQGVRFYPGMLCYDQAYCSALRHVGPIVCRYSTDCAKGCAGVRAGSRDQLWAVVYYRPSGSTRRMENIHVPSYLRNFNHV